MVGCLRNMSEDREGKGIITAIIGFISSIFKMFL